MNIIQLLQEKKKLFKYHTLWWKEKRDTMIRFGILLTNLDPSIGSFGKPFTELESIERKIWKRHLSREKLELKKHSPQIECWEMFSHVCSSWNGFVYQYCTFAFYSADHLSSKFPWDANQTIGYFHKQIEQCSGGAKTKVKRKKKKKRWTTPEHAKTQDHFHWWMEPQIFQECLGFGLYWAEHRHTRTLAY